MTKKFSFPRSVGMIAVATCVMLTACSARMYTLTLASEDGSKSVNLDVEVADTVNERAQGLMYRNGLAEGKGMLFVFAEPQILSFWMRNTKIPLEILFFDPNGRFINAHQMEPCKEDPCVTYESKEAALYALEVNTDFRKNNDVGVGWKLDLAQVNGMAQAR